MSICNVLIEVSKLMPLETKECLKVNERQALALLTVTVWVGIREGVFRGEIV